MEYDTEEENEEGGMWQRIKESPRTVSALIIILIVAAAIYAFSGNEPKKDGDDVALVTDQTTEESPAADAEKDEEGDTMQATTAPTNTPSETTMQSAKPTAAPTVMPEARKTENSYVEVAGAGDSITKLARRATSRYLEENKADYTVTNEHRIYIEDYIKDKLGSKPLAIGEEQTISFDLLKEAVDSAKNLSDSQLHNLTKYTSAL